MTLSKLRPKPTLVIIFFFLASGVLRVADNAGAIAKEVAEVAGAGAANLAGQNCPAPFEPEIMVQALLEREANLDQLEERLMDREQVLRVAKLRIEDQLKTLEDAEKRLADTLAIADKAAEKDIERLTSVYENMKPKEAAEIFETMDISFAAGFLSRMRPDAAAGILSNIDTGRAYSISVVMAGRNANVPTE